MSKILDTYFQLIKKFIPEKISLPAVGLDIGTHSCKAVQLNQRNNQFEIINWSVEPIEGGDPRSAIKKILEKFYMQTKNTGRESPLNTDG